jgi:hypothetical protein
MIALRIVRLSIAASASENHSNGKVCPVISDTRTEPFASNCSASRRSSGEAEYDVTILISR